MRQLLRLAIAAALVLAGGSVTPAADKLAVVTSLPDLAAVAKEVAGDRADVISLAESTQNPHFVDARPHLILELNRADLLVHSGLELEIGWLPVLVRGSRNPRIYDGTPGNLDASTAIKVKDVPGGKVDRTMGDVHAGGNPHYMNDPHNAARVAQAIADRLAKLDPPNAGAFKTRLAAFQARAREEGKRIRARFRALPPARRRIVTYHRSLTYLVDWLGLTVVDELEPKPGIPPSPAHVATVLAEIRQSHVPVIVQESFYPSRMSELVAARSGAKLVVLPGFPDYGSGQSYLDHLEKMTDKLYDALEARS